MKLYMAPLEGIGGSIFRNALAKHFGGVDIYFAPFVNASMHRSRGSRELRDILPEKNTQVSLVPQILTCDAQAMVQTIREMKTLGYEEVNLNLGCPSKIVVAKGRGAGFLAAPEKLERFLDEVFSSGEVRLSVKTRIGKEEPGEMSELLRIFNQFPLKELIVHPRVQKEFYRNTPNLEVFGQIAKESRAPVCYNGDLFSKEAYLAFRERFPEVSRVMLGRGLLMNPGLAREIRGGNAPEIEQWRAFHDQLYEEYQMELQNEKNVLCKMKELWTWWGRYFPGDAEVLREIKRAQHFQTYEEAVKAGFSFSFGHKVNIIVTKQAVPPK